MGRYGAYGWPHWQCWHRRGQRAVRQWAVDSGHWALGTGYWQLGFNGPAWGLWAWTAGPGLVAGQGGAVSLAACNHLVASLALYLMEESKRGPSRAA